MVITLIILLLTAILLVHGKIRSDIIAMCSLLALVLSGILEPGEALSGFSNDVVLMIAGLFIVGGAITRTGIANKLSEAVLAFAGNSEMKLFILVMLTTVVVGLFVSNTGTVAILMPIVVSIAHRANVSASRLLMPMAFASSIGGMMTLIGTPPTLIAHGALIDAGYEGLEFFTTLPVGLILLVIGLAILWFASRLLVKDEHHDQGGGQAGIKSPEQLASDYHIIDNLYRIKIPAGAPILNRPLSELNITQEYLVSIAEVRVRKNTPLGRSMAAHIPTAGTVLSEGNVIYVLGEYQNVERFVQENHLLMLDETEDETSVKPRFAGKLDFEENGIAEVVVLANSPLNGKEVHETDFRNNYNVNILGIQRKDHYILEDLKSQRILSGDMLLIQGTWEDIARLNRLESEVVVIGQPEDQASRITIDRKAPYSASIVLLMVLAMVFNWLPPVIAVLLAAVLLILGGCFRNVQDAYRSINWESVILFAAMMPLATAMQKTGLSDAISGGIVDSLGQYGPYAILAGILAATSLLTMFISNTATAVLFVPIAIASAQNMGISPLPLVIGVAVAASMCLASPFSTPPNAMVMSAGRYNFMDYIKVGLPLQLIYLVVMVIALPLLFPF